MNMEEVKKQMKMKSLANAIGGCCGSSTDH